MVTRLTEFCKENNIFAGFFSGLGACSEVMLAYYDLERKEYLDHHKKEDLEIVSLTGNIAKMDEKIVIHVHGSVSNRAFQTFSGHVKKLVVSATCEVHLTTLPKRMERAFDEETGLNLLK